MCAFWKKLKRPRWPWGSDHFALQLCSGDSEAAIRFTQCRRKKQLNFLRRVFARAFGPEVDRKLVVFLDKLELSTGRKNPQRPEADEYRRFVEYFFFLMEITEDKWTAQSDKPVEFDQKWLVYFGYHTFEVLVDEALLLYGSRRLKES